MKHNVMITIASLIAILLMTFHMTYDLRQAKIAENMYQTLILLFRAPGVYRE